jgi:hypothetical protein
VELEQAERRQDGRSFSHGRDFGKLDITVMISLPDARTQTQEIIGSMAEMGSTGFGLRVCKPSGILCTSFELGT